MRREIFDEGGAGGWPEKGTWDAFVGGEEIKRNFCDKLKYY